MIYAILFVAITIPLMPVSIKRRTSFLREQVMKKAKMLGVEVQFDD